MRKVIAAVFAVLVATSVSGCASHTANDMYSNLESVCGTYATGKNVDTVSVTETKGSKVPTVKFALGIDSKKIETKVITEGTGPKITGNQFIGFEFVSVVGKNGTVAGNSTFNGSDVQSQFLEKETQLCGSLAGVREGSRVAVLYPSSIMSAGEAEPSSAVILFDIKKVYLPKAAGDDMGNGSDLPTVIRATTGQPTIQFQDKPAPTELKVHTLIRGWGEKVAKDKGQRIVMHYTGWLWNNASSVFDSSWEQGRPVEFDFATNSLIDGMIDGLTGQTVGSQVLLVIPPALGYKDKEVGGIPANSTIVFVVDILGVSK